MLSVAVADVMEVQYTYRGQHLGKIALRQVSRLMSSFPEQDHDRRDRHQHSDKDTNKDTNQALGEIYKKLRPGEPHTMESAHNLFHNLFFNPQKYNFSRIGRLKMNIKLEMDTSLEEKTLTPMDFVEVIKYLLGLRVGRRHGG